MKAELEPALAELRLMISRRYPKAAFAVYRGEDPEGIRLEATVPNADTDDILDVVIDKLYEYQVEKGLPIYVVHASTPEEVARQLQAHRSERDRVQSPSALLHPQATR